MPVVDALAERTDEGRCYATEIDGLPLTALPVGFRMRQLCLMKVRQLLSEYPASRGNRVIKATS